MIWIVLSGRFGVGGFVGVCCFVWGLDSCVCWYFGKFGFGLGFSA